MKSRTIIEGQCRGRLSTDPKKDDSTLPHITDGHVDSTIVSEAYHLFPGTQLTVCCLTLKNGFTVTGENACVSPELFNARIGRSLAKTMARNKVWMLEGYLLKETLAKGKED